MTKEQRKRPAGKSKRSSSSPPRGPAEIVAPPWECYVADVLSGEIDVCRWVRLACERHERDKKRTDIFFDEAAAWRPIRFLSLLKHYEGEWSGRPFVMEPWQAFITASLFGWRRKDDGLRRYQYGYIEIPRKNGKSFYAAGITLYMLVADGEPGGQAYAAATKESQSRIVWDNVRVMVEECGEPEFQKQMKIRQKPPIIDHLPSRSNFKPLSREAKSYDGLNPHMVIMDELHAWPESAQALWNVLDTAVGARSQPMILQITTAGDILEGVCRRQEKAVQSILNQTFENDAYFGIIYTLDEEDLIDDKGQRDLTRLKDQRLWRKANPNYGVSVLPKQAEKAYLTASAPATATQGFQALQTKHFNIWVNSATAWLSILDWKECHDEIDVESLVEGRLCYGGLDLAQVRDQSALALLFPPEEKGEKWIALLHYWCPEENIDRRTKVDSVPYRAWAEKGFITPTPGRVTDYRYIENAIKEIPNKYDLQSLAFDRTFSGQIVQNLLDEGIEMVQFGQGYMSMSAPCKEFERMVIGKEINHLNNPILQWNAENAIVLTDPAGNIKIDKSNDKKRVDGLVASVMGLGLALVDSEDVIQFERW